MKLLVIDDEKNLRQVLRAELADQGAPVAEAENGLKALALLERDPLASSPFVQVPYISILMTMEAVR